MVTLRGTDDERMRDHIIDELFSFDNPELLSNGSPFLFFVGITAKKSVFIDHDLSRILWAGMREAMIYYFPPEGFQSRYIDAYYKVYNEYQDGKWNISVNCGDKLEISLYYGGISVYSQFTTVDYFEKVFKQVWREYQRRKNQ